MYVGLGGGRNGLFFQRSKVVNIVPNWRAEVRHCHSAISSGGGGGAPSAVRARDRPVCARQARVRATGPSPRDRPVPAPQALWVRRGAAGSGALGRGAPRDVPV